jgi:hypothetical protein
MPTREYDRRWIDGGIGWAWVWLRKPGNSLTIAVAAVVSACLIGGAILLLTIVAATFNTEPSELAHE